MTENYNIHRCDHCSGPKIRKSKLDKLKEKVEKREKEFKKAIKKKGYINLPLFNKKELNVVMGTYIETKKGRKKIKPIYKRIKNDKLYELVKNYIIKLKKENIEYVYAEKIAEKFKVKKHRIKVVFMLLNKESILGQAENKPPHDSNRNLSMMDYGPDNSWRASRYEIL